MKVQRFNSFKINESDQSEMTLYRLSSHSVIDFENPGSYYFSNREDVDPNVLDKNSNMYYLLTVKCPASNVDSDKTQAEVEKTGVDSIVAVRDEKNCKVITAEPYQ